MTPKSRDELAIWLRHKISTIKALEGTELMPTSLMSALSAAGLAIVPKEPTDEMVDLGWVAILRDKEMDPPWPPTRCYRAMLDASPFKEPGE